MEAALKEWQNALPGTIVFRTVKLPGDTHFLRFTNAAGCGGALRGQDVPQFSSLNCSAGTLLHEIIGPDLQEMRNIHERLKPTPWVASDWGRGDR